MVVMVLDYRANTPNITDHYSFILKALYFILSTAPTKGLLLKTP